MKPRLLYLTHRLPYPPDKGDRIRNYHVLRQLSRVARVSLAALADEPVTQEQRSALESLCERVAIVPVSPRLRKISAALSAIRGRSLTEGAFHEPAFDAVLRDWGKETSWHAALVSASSLGPYLKRNGLDRLPRFVDLVDVDSQKWFDFAAAARWPKTLLYRFEANRVRKLERNIATWARGIFLVSKHEAAVFDGFTKPGPRRQDAGAGEPKAATVATNGVDLDYFHPMPEVAEQPACAFVGAMDYFPNIDGAIWFANDIWPAIRARRPDAEFWIIGRKPTPEVLALGKLPGVKVTGSVPDVRPHVAAAMLAVAPIRVARGLQNKVLEAMAMGKPTLAAPAAIAALKVEPGRHLLCPRSTDEWVAAVCDLLDSPERRTSLGHAGRQFVETEHHWDRCLQPMIDAMALCHN